MEKAKSNKVAFPRGICAAGGSGDGVENVVGSLCCQTLVKEGGIGQGTGDASGARRRDIWKRDKLSAMLLSTLGHVWQ